MVRQGIGGKIADISIYVFLGIIAISIIFPFYSSILISFAKYEDVATTTFYIYPKSFTLENYARIFTDSKFINSIWVSTFNVVMGTSMSLIMTVLAAYALSRKNVPFRRVMFYFCIFTMFFSAGLIPWYLVLKDLGFVDSIWVMTVPGMLSTFNMILVRNYFFSLPDSIEESARIDGAGEFVIMWRIVVPLSAPIIATICLFNAVYFWNEWWNAMLFIQNSKLIPLPLLLRNLIIENSVQMGDPMLNTMRQRVTLVHTRSIQLATVMVATFPILCVYPFLQKYFTKGIMLGSIKA